MVVLTRAVRKQAHPVAVIVGLVAAKKYHAHYASDIERQQFAFVHADEAKHVRLPMLAMQHPPNTGCFA